jgi:hypothetical protein
VKSAINPVLLGITLAAPNFTALILTRVKNSVASKLGRNNELTLPPL